MRKSNKKRQNFGSSVIKSSVVLGDRSLTGQAVPDDDKQSAILEGESNEGTVADGGSRHEHISTTI